MKKLTLLYALLILLMISCQKKDTTTNPSPVPTDNMEILTAPAGFTFSTNKKIALNLKTLDNVNQPVSGIRLNILNNYPEAGGELIASCITNGNGSFETDLQIPSWIDSLVVETKALGFAQYQKISIQNNRLDAVLGGSNPIHYSSVSFATSGSSNDNALISQLGAMPPVHAMGTYNGMGVPNYLMPQNDLIDAAFISDINAALPESQPVPNYHPQYLNKDNKTNLEFQSPSRVWVSFVHEGAGYRNVLCYYVYDPSKPPASISDIDTLRAIFPNVSFVNSGGGLVSGNKVELGVFRPGQAIGWAIIANGYNGSTITSGAGLYFSQSNLNPEIKPENKIHCLLLNDVNREKLLLSFEDLNREGSCDNDFNDAIFYVTADPIQSIVTTNIAMPAYTNLDTDKDGVYDNFDDYPNDPTKALNNFYPSQNTFGTLAFEDLWPSTGDYDFNDLVLDYQFNPITNAKNEVVQLKMVFSVKAIGASYHNGFGIQLPIDPSLISKVSGANTKGSLIKRNANGTESNQSKATIIAFEDAFYELPWPGGNAIGVNTTPGAPYVQPKKMELTIDFTSPISQPTLGLPPYNPFIFINKNRSVEVHLINKAPTDLADSKLFGSEADKSDPLMGKYYTTDRNLPFVLDIAGPFDYVSEKVRITKGYLKFYDWAVSSGLTFRDWYKPTTNYRDPSKIFIR